MSSAQVLKPVRRIVTGHTAKGRSTIVNDGPTPNVFVSTDVEGFGAIVPWQTEPGDLSNDDNNDPAPAEAEVPMSPKLGGTVFRIASFPPDESYSDAAADSLFGDIGGDHARDAAQDTEGDRHFWFHRTDSLDYAIVLEGEIWLLTDEEETLARTGDVIIQRGTNHSWANRSDRTCRMAFVLMGALPVGSAASVVS
ncbi:MULTISPECIES: cupin domain-containing protein [unclassified Streptomyces]|uniref:Cupin domain-containing protein n=1 Tax=Streptomyces sp. NBC_00119 TaxID=2975659 RepID=A0AAU1U5M1_9ACTN|nr:MULTISPECIES: cupin domain-containing protein [unclassified Streptomyces]MCX5435665.1 cupin domain-containing protein [Streptomyces sp. NBC_00063]WSE08804.1 cupin domain-containing protein [Streptomyces sp. NBC_01445]WSE13459.1 cupin domain-containing protein [Streptomyces sp. NBC_01397]WUB97625.1 cupin domain-containing protein [Streptomyces sp. NBC_00569]